VRLVIDLDWTTIQSSPSYSEWGWYGADPWTWIDMPPVYGAIESLVELHELRHDITFVTARFEHPVTEQWLCDHLGVGWYDLVEGVTDKHVIPADIYLDDSPKFLEGMWRAGVCTVKFCHEHNIDAPCSYKVNTWAQFVRLVESPDTDTAVPRRTDPYKMKRAALGDRSGLILP
jgi:hypothetical protein